MTILFIDQFSEPGGAQQVLWELLGAVRDRGWQAALGLPGNGELAVKARELGLPVEEVDCWPRKMGRKIPDVGRFLTHSFRLARRIRELTDRYRPDLLYLNGPRVVPAASLAGVKCPVLFHAHSRISDGRDMRVTGWGLSRMRAHVVANCEFVAKPLRRYVPPERLAIVWHGVTGPSHVPERAPGQQPRIACVGRIHPQKGQREFLRVAARVHESVPDCRFVIYGEAMFGDSPQAGYAGEVRALAAGLAVEFPGWIQDVAGALADVDLVLVPSQVAEATPRVIGEAYAAGVPVVAFSTGGVPEIVQHGVTGMLVASVEDMARDTIALLREEDRRLAMGRAGRALWESRLTMAQFHEALLPLIARFA